MDRARDRLATQGYHPTLATADGVAGLPEHGPYDRIIATCAVSRIPWSWAEQTSPGGLILVDLKVHAAVGNLVLLRRRADRLEGRFDSGYATFMHMRTPIFEAATEPQPRPDRHRDNARRRTTTLVIERLWENLPLWFLLHVAERGRVEFGYALDPATGGPGPLIFSSRDGSWCELRTTYDGNREVWEGGPRHLWTSIEATTELWHQLGEPGWNRFGLTVYSDDTQVVWLDDPTSENLWSL
ncbi:MAG: hypothetical protein ACRDTE_24105 [Pseudonocardiaceae bacterium]